ncbi:MAG: hypothetical protein R2809_11080 [Flavobacteriales bacterium]
MWGQSDTVFVRYNQDKFEDKLNYAIDTIVFDTPNAREILYGTTVLPWTSSQQIAKNLVSYSAILAISECKQSDKPT